MRSRTCAVLFAAALLATGIPGGAGAAARAAPWAVFAPDIVDDSAGQRLSKVRGLDPKSLYLFRHDGSQKRLAVRGVRFFNLSAASPAGLVAAAVVWDSSRARRPGASYAVLVIDTSGTEVAAFQNARGFDWSPDGRRLALRFATSVPDLAPDPDSLGVWDVRTRKVRIFREHAYEIGWLSSDTLVLGIYSRSMSTGVLSLRSGALRRGWRGGVDPSPDGKYSISRPSESENQVWDDRASAPIEIGGRIEALLEGGRSFKWPIPPSWLATSRPGHILCVPSCRYHDSRINPTKGPPECAVYLIDPAAMRVLAKYPGKGIGPTADRRGVVILRGSDLQFIDLAKAIE